jgi:hypothetical protein
MGVWINLISWAQYTDRFWAVYAKDAFATMLLELVFTSDYSQAIDGLLPIVNNGPQRRRSDGACCFIEILRCATASRSWRSAIETIAELLRLALVQTSGRTEITPHQNIGALV